ncbi:hypothetical protein VDGL01_07394 [Verticillium dahliae]
MKSWMRLSAVQGRGGSDGARQGGKTGAKVGNVTRGGAVRGQTGQGSTAVPIAATWVEALTRLDSSRNGIGMPLMIGPLADKEAQAMTSPVCPSFVCVVDGGAPHATLLQKDWCRRAGTTRYDVILSGSRDDWPSPAGGSCRVRASLDDDDDGCGGVGDGEGNEEQKKWKKAEGRRLCDVSLDT